MRPSLLSPRSCLENACARRIRGATSHVRLRAAPTYTEFGADGPPGARSRARIGCCRGVDASNGRTAAPCVSPRSWESVGSRQHSKSTLWLTSRSPCTPRGTSSNGSSVLSGACLQGADQQPSLPVVRREDRSPLVVATVVVSPRRPLCRPRSAVRWRAEWRQVLRHILGQCSARTGSDVQQPSHPFPLCMVCSLRALWLAGPSSILDQTSRYVLHRNRLSQTLSVSRGQRGRRRCGVRYRARQRIGVGSTGRIHRPARWCGAHRPPGARN